MRISPLLHFLSVREREISDSIRKISSGLRINGSSDDPVGLGVSSRLSLQIRKNIISIHNINTGISIVRTAEDALAKVSMILEKIRTLVVRSGSDTLTDLDREKCLYEINQLLSQIDNIAHSTKYNNKNLIDGSLEKTLLLLEGNRYLEDIKLDNIESGTYNISIISGGKEEKIALPFRFPGEISLSSSLYDALGESSVSSYYKTLNINDGVYNVSIIFDVNPYGGDTVGSAVEKLNNAFFSNGIPITASFDEGNKYIILSSTEPGTKYNINIKETNSIDEAINFGDTIEISALEGSNGPFSYRRLTSIAGAISGPLVTGGTLIRDYFKTSNPLAFQFKGFGGAILTLNIPTSYTLDYTAFYIKSQLKTNLGLNVNVVFDGNSTDTFRFDYPSGDQRLELSITGGIHQETYLTVDATQETLLGNILDLEDGLSLTFLDQYGPLATLNFTKTSSIQDVIDDINNSRLDIIASYDGGIIKLDQSYRVSKIIGILQTGTDCFSVEKNIYPSGYPILELPEDITVSINGDIYSSPSREFNLLGLNFTFAKEALESLANIKISVISGYLPLLIGEERVDISLPDVTLRSIGLTGIDLYDSNYLLERLDRAIEKVNLERVNLGTYENTFKDLIQNLECYGLSLQEAKSRITDVDMAREISNLIRKKILYATEVYLILDVRELYSREILGLI
ncbi:MAG: flagellin [bacterium]